MHNLHIRWKCKTLQAIYNGQKNEKALVEYMRYKEFWSIEPYLEKSIKEYL